MGEREMMETGLTGENLRKEIQTLCSLFSPFGFWSNTDLVNFYRKLIRCLGRSGRNLELFIKNKSMQGNNQLLQMYFKYFYYALNNSSILGERTLPHNNSDSKPAQKDSPRRSKCVSTLVSWNLTDYLPLTLSACVFDFVSLLITVPRLSFSHKLPFLVSHSLTS